MGLTQYAESNTIQGLGNRDQIGRQVPDVGGRGRGVAQRVQTPRCTTGKSRDPVYSVVTPRSDRTCGICCASGASVSFHGLTEVTVTERSFWEAPGLANGRRCGKRLTVCLCIRSSRRTPETQQSHVLFPPHPLPREGWEEGSPQSQGVRAQLHCSSVSRTWCRCLLSTHSRMCKAFAPR